MSNDVIVYFGKLIMNPDLIDKTNNTEDSFKHPADKFLFRTLKKMREEKKEIGVVEISEEIGDCWLNICLAMVREFLKAR